MPTKKVEKKEEVNTAHMVSYTMKATIRTGDYSNISPEFTVYANTLEEASNIILEHTDFLHKKYYNFLVETVRQPEPEPLLQVSPVVASVPKLPTEQSKWYTKAEAAVKSCMNVEALAQIKEKITVSEKGSPKEKALLEEIIEAQFKKINEKPNQQ